MDRLDMASQCISRPADTVASLEGVTGFPWASLGRRPAESGAYTSYPNPWSDMAMSDANQSPVIDFRLVNATYNASNKSVDFDVDVTPLLRSRMPNEDTVTYVTVSAVTEDGIISSKQFNPNDGSPETVIDGFINHNVARAVGGKVLGDAFVIKTATKWPIRRHYHISTSNSDWNQDSLRIKAFAAIAGKVSHLQSYLDAGQTGYITKLPSTAPPVIWPVLPAKNAIISGDSTEIPIVWASGGGVNSASINYSIDGGKNWLPVVASTSVSPYEWQLPDSAYSHSVMLQIGDASNVAADSVGPAFSIGVKPIPVITVTSPIASDSLLVGTTHAISFLASGPVNESSVTLEYSTDSMTTWNPIATIANKTSYNWVIPKAPSAAAFIRVTDAKGVAGVSGMFSILDSGKVTNVTVDGAPNLPSGVPETIRWNVAGFLGETLNIDLFNPVSASYSPIAVGLGAGITSYNWTTVPSAQQSGYMIRVKYASGAVGTSAPFAIGESGVGTNASSESLSLAPNPLSIGATLRFSLDASANVTLVVRDLLGRELVRIPEGTLAAGSHEIAIDGTRLAAGAYEYQLLAGSKSFLGKFSVVR